MLALSGGIDSLATACILKSDAYNVIPVYFNNYSKANCMQIKSAKHCSNYLNTSINIVDFSFYKNLPILNNESQDLNQHAAKNALFFMLSTLCLIALRINASSVSLGLNAEDIKKHPMIATSFVSLVKEIGRSTLNDRITENHCLNAIFPLESKNKVQVLQKLAELKAPIKHTYSCSEGGSEHCGICSCCMSRKTVFVKANINDTTIYKA